MTFKKTLAVIFLVSCPGQLTHAQPAKKGSVTEISKGNVQDFNDTINAGGIVVVNFGSIKRCKPCKNLEPEFKKTAIKNTEVAFLKVDVDKNPKLAQRHTIRSMPTIIIFKDGEIVDRESGYKTEKQLQEMIKKYL